MSTQTTTLTVPAPLSAHKTGYKSTPISEYVCPRRSQRIAEEHTVTLTNAGTHEYTCTCGQVFIWEDQTHYEYIENVS